MKVLVTGGAGYVGSHAVRALLDAGHEVLVLDTLEKGHADACPGAQFVLGSTADFDLVSALLESEPIGCVMHFAAYAEVAESMKRPERYYANNTAATAVLVRACVEKGVNRFVFSSTCAVYGEPQSLPLVETAPKKPVSPYGHSKRLSEEILDFVSRRTALRYVALRYFNAAGAHASGTLGEDHTPETHLIPLVLQAALGRREAARLFGTDYPTPDGTCVRDYIHASDLARAHLAAMEYLLHGEESASFNVGTGEGHSVREVVELCRQVTGHPIPTVEEARRQGDPPALYADASLIRKRLGWTPQESDLEQIIASAWKWHSLHPRGYH
ncbi:MAG: UDP-glucose 4-epimerase GalE [Planctomycetota bacterium]